MIRCVLVWDQHNELSSQAQSQSSNSTNIILTEIITRDVVTMWGACTQSHEWAWLCDKLSVSWLLISPGCTANTVLAVKHLIYWQKELVFDPTFRTSAGNRFLTPSRIFLLSVVPQKPTNPIVAGFGWRGTGETISDLQIEMFTNSDEQNWNTEDLKNWPKENVSFITNIQIIPTIRKCCRGDDCSPHSVKSVWRQRVEVVIGFIFTQEGRLFVALIKSVTESVEV